jgi:hypothetical protein
MPTAVNVGFAEYDADQIRLNGWGYSISKGIGQSGYADGLFCKIKPDGPSFTTKRGTDGFITRSKTNNYLVEIELHIAQANSATNDFLSSLLATDEQNPNGAGVGTFNMEDLAGTSLLSCGYAWVAGFAEQDFAREPEDRTWIVHGLRSALNVGGN